MASLRHPEPNKSSHQSVTQFKPINYNYNYDNDFFEDVSLDSSSPGVNVRPSIKSSRSHLSVAQSYNGNKIINTSVQSHSFITVDTDKNNVSSNNTSRLSLTDSMTGAKSRNHSIVSSMSMTSESTTTFQPSNSHTSPQTRSNSRPYLPMTSKNNSNVTMNEEPSSQNAPGPNMPAGTNHNPNTNSSTPNSNSTSPVSTRDLNQNAPGFKARRRSSHTIDLTQENIRRAKSFSHRDIEDIDNISPLPLFYKDKQKGRITSPKSKSNLKDTNLSKNNSNYYSNIATPLSNDIKRSSAPVSKINRSLSLKNTTSSRPYSLPAPNNVKSSLNVTSSDYPSGSHLNSTSASSVRVYRALSSNNSLSRRNSRKSILSSLLNLNNNNDNNNTQLDNYDIDYDDDIIPDEISVFNVPLSASLLDTNRTKKSIGNNNNNTRNQISGSNNNTNKNINNLNIKNINKAINSNEHTLSMTSEQSTDSNTNTRSSLDSIASTDITTTLPSSGSPYHSDKFIFNLNTDSNWISNLSKDAIDLSLAFEQSPTTLAHEEFLQKKLSIINNNNNNLNLNNTNANGFENDLIPISKEKEEVLSFTRPSWLPPKNKQEEQKHLKEYEKLMNNAIKEEKLKTVKKMKSINLKQKQKIDDLLIWNNKIIPNFNKIFINNNITIETRELWWRGIPLQHRSFIYSNIIGNGLKINEDVYEMALEKSNKAQNIVSEIDQLTNQAISNQNNQFQNQNNNNNDKNLKTKYSLGVESIHYNEYKELFLKIEEDITKTFPDLKLFQAPTSNSNNNNNNNNNNNEKGIYYKPLKNILLAFSFFKIGGIKYTTGINTIAAMILYVLDNELDTFVLLSNLLLKRPLLNSLILSSINNNNNKNDINNEDNENNDLTNNINNNESILIDNLQSFLKVFKNKLPSLYKHFHQTIKISTISYLKPLILPLFTQHLSLNISLRIFDIFIFEGDSFLLRCALALLSKIEHKLYGNKNEILNILGWDSVYKTNIKKFKKEISINGNDNDDNDIDFDSDFNNSEFLSSYNYEYLDVGSEDEFMEKVRDILKTHPKQ